MIANREELFVVKDAARILRISEYTVRERLKEKKIEGFKLGGRDWRMTSEALNNYMEKYATAS